MKRTLGGIAIGLLAGAVIFGGLTAAGALTMNGPAAYTAAATATRSQEASHSVPATTTPVPQPTHAQDATHSPDPVKHQVEAQHQSGTTDHTARVRADSTSVHHPEPAHTAAPAPTPTPSPAPAPAPTHMHGGDHDGGSHE